ncbi:hypothetical protein CSUI_008760 [Cystoisospora suis]|uniref:Uncharacterized protein n=1 Tax=Cystoisospora suis TaxID=483139 RepID=A0A2C6KLB9_9APIC|nr:hypothetical protein CSUI_008760 [Cystoisospora suis]
MEHTPLGTPKRGTEILCHHTHRSISNHVGVCVYKRRFPRRSFAHMRFVKAL